MLIPPAALPQTPAHQHYLQQQQDVWFTGQSTEVLLRVSPTVAHYFIRRPLLPRQQTRDDPDDGSLLVTTHIHHPQQPLPVVRFWLPHVRILQPAEWHDTLVQELQQALAQWQAMPAATPTAAPKANKAHK